MPDISGLRIGLTHAMSKASWGTMMPRWDSQPNNTSIGVVAACNEVVGFQVRLIAHEPFVLVLDGTNWLHPLGFLPRVRMVVSFPSLPSAAVEVLAIGYLEGDDRREWMESLDRTGYAEAPAGKSQGAYVRLSVPADLPAGLHTGQIKAYTQQGFGDEELAWTGTVSLEVANVVLPEPRDWSFHLALWLHSTALARYHRVPMWGDDHFALLDRYYASAARLGQKAVTVMGAEIPWSGQRCFRDQAYPAYLFEHSIIDVTRDTGGALHCDYSKLERLLAIAARHGTDQEIDVFGLLNIWQDEEFGFGKVALDAPDAVRVRCFDDGSGTFSYLRTAGELRAYIEALHGYFSASGLLPKVRIAADEPSDLEAFSQNVAFLREAAPGFQYKVYMNHFEFVEQAPPEVMDAVPVLHLACRDPQLTERLTEHLRARGGRMSWYVCCNPPRPNTFLHSPLVEGQLHGWLTYHLGLDGFDRWAFCLWPADPWRRVSWRAPNWHAGDMYFVLPGYDGAPVETLRYEALRTGIQDYELLKLVQRTLPAAEASEVSERAFGHILRAHSVADFANVATTRAEELYSLDPADYQMARRVLLQALDPASERAAAVPLER